MHTGQRISRALFGPACDGMQAALYTLRSTSGISVGVTNYGAALQSLVLPSRTHELQDCVLGFDDLAGYRSPQNPYFGAVVGRVANRIAKGRFCVGDKCYVLDCNNSPNTLHGGERGFDKVLWDATVIDEPGAPAALRLSYTSPAGDQGFPGECTATVTYR